MWWLLLLGAVVLTVVVRWMRKGWKPRTPDEKTMARRLRMYGPHLDIKPSGSIEVDPAVLLRPRHQVT